jgi:hypothetical protein
LLWQQNRKYKTYTLKGFSIPLAHASCSSTETAFLRTGSPIFGGNKKASFKKEGRKRIRKPLFKGVWWSYCVSPELFASLNKLKNF